MCAFGQVRSAAIRARRNPGFTLIELLVVVAIIALLISILLPSLQAAREEAQAAACMSNEHQLYAAIAMYQQESQDWVPKNMWSESAWYVPKKDLWFYKLVPTYLGDPRALACPGDPYRGVFDFEAITEEGAWHENAEAASCGYGMNYLLRHFHERAAQIERFPPTSPERTILFAEVGPDDDLPRAALYGRDPATTRTAIAWRDGGRLVWHDGIRPWISPARSRSWLTVRHRGSVIMTGFAGNTKRVRSAKQVQGGIVQETQRGRSAECYFCVYETSSAERGHYCFDESDMYWWTGPYPNYP